MADRFNLSYSFCLIVNSEWLLRSLVKKDSEAFEAQLGWYEI